MIRATIVAAAVLAASLGHADQASPGGQAMPDGVENTILTVQGPDTMRQYDLAALRALPRAGFVTTTPWTAGPQTFTGVPLAALLEDAGIYDGFVRAVAVNDYAVVLALDEMQPDAEGHGPILAYLHNGEEMSLREKGPLWIVWPYDADPKFSTELVFADSIWQVREIRPVPAAH